MTMRGVADAVRLRNRVIERFEEVSHPRRGTRVQAHFCGYRRRGYRGRGGLRDSHPRPREPRARLPELPCGIYLIEALPNILPELDPALRRAARARLLNERIEVLTGAMAEEITGDRVKLKGGKQIDTENVIWTAGNREPDGTGSRVAP